jgi:DNA-binding transcriptional regulator YiaG
MTRYFREALLRLGISQPQAAAYLDVNERTVRRWCRDDVEEPSDVRERLEHALKEQEHDEGKEVQG